MSIVRRAESFIVGVEWFAMEEIEKEGLISLLRYSNEDYYSVIPLKEGRYLFIWLKLRLEADGKIVYNTYPSFSDHSHMYVQFIYDEKIQKPVVTEIKDIPGKTRVLEYLLPVDLQLITE